MIMVLPGEHIKRSGPFMMIAVGDSTRRSSWGSLFIYFNACYLDQ